MDYKLEHLINGPAGHHAALDSLMRHVASWSQYVFVAIVVLWFVLGWARGRGGDRQGALTATVAAGIALLLNQAIAQLWQRPRPFVSHRGTVHTLIAHGTDSSFPSDHAAAGFAIAVVLVASHRRLGGLALAFAVLMAYARVYVGVHYPGDVAAGALVGLVVALVLLLWATPAMAALRAAIDRLIRLLRLPLPAAAGSEVGPLPRR